MPFVYCIVSRPLVSSLLSVSFVPSILPSLTRVVLDDVAESLQRHLGEAESLGVLLGLHLVALAHGQQGVEVLGLGADVVQETGCKHFRELKPEEVKHSSAQPNFTHSATAEIFDNDPICSNETFLHYVLPFFLTFLLSS